MMTDIDEPHTYVTPASSARKVRTALRAAFKTKFSVTSNGLFINIKWEDTGPTQDEVTAAIKNAGLAEIPRTWNDTEYLDVDGHSLSFLRYNTAQREADQRDSERRQQEYAAQQERARSAIAEAYEAKRAARPKISWQRAPEPKPAVYEAFERLREKAEAQVVAHEGDRRPSWAPPLILGEELTAACLELGWLTADDKPIGRLWATFASPKASKRYVREHVSTLPLHGIACRGFQLFSGGERQLTSAILFEAQRRGDGTWSCGPSFYPHEYTNPRPGAWEDLIRERERVSHSLTHTNFSEEARAQEEARLGQITADIGTLDTQEAEAAEKYYKRQQLRQRTLTLAQARVLDFIGAPDAQMQAAGRLWGHCCRCGKALTDPLSLERGIGPDCYDGILSEIRAMAAAEYAVNRISWLIGMPVEFVNTVLSEPVVKPRHRPAPIPYLFPPVIGAADPVAADDDWMLPGD